MKKTHLFLIAVLFISFQSFSQKSEYRYMALKFGATHCFSATPAMNPNKYLNTPVGEMQLTPVSSAYVPGFSFAVLYHFDFTSDNAGVYTGLEYNWGGMGAKYKTNFGGYTMNEIHRFHSLGVPLAFKYGPKMSKDQRYIEAGVQANMTLLVKSIQKVNFQGTLSSTKLAPEAFNHFGFNMFLGLNFLMFNVQFNYYPKSLFNPLYVSPEGLKSYAGQPEHAFVIKTSINVPYGFLSHKYFWWRKVLKGTPWR